MIVCGVNVQCGASFGSTNCDREEDGSMQAAYLNIANKRCIGINFGLTLLFRLEHKMWDCAESIQHILCDICGLSAK